MVKDAPPSFGSFWAARRQEGGRPRWHGVAQSSLAEITLSETINELNVRILATLFVWKLEFSKRKEKKTFVASWLLRAWIFLRLLHGWLDEEMCYDNYENYFWCTALFQWKFCHWCGFKCDANMFPFPPSLTTLSSRDSLHRSTGNPQHKWIATMHTTTCRYHPTMSTEYLILTNTTDFHPRPRFAKTKLKRSCHKRSLRRSICSVSDLQDIPSL
jgi:hypothetical protein